ncbi:DNA phosphorothioation-associated putative methyltransferase [Anabaena sp. UHCC 0451]|uniref:DNA phosphorothioation-associated putative methyltransferase n=1 Tax=Anabaena sp. UHCC 0451 TaxID=2055235 RepID=UPI002B20290A|nr:DNA phosphorothioation-associated putative methyltransferase [Anabaena sp. UHCC 0451]MEA5579449.1 DNA phosphorothioation-associated putative methyltransferase [Anabaena sp. UHCC 0451]
MVKSDNSLNNLEEICSTPELIEISAIAAYCYNSQYGKLLPDAFYIHILELHTLDIQLQQYESLARSVAPQTEKATLVKFSTNKLKISYLFYPDFDTDPHPALHSSIQVDVENLTFSYRDYTDTENPPILHRKETFVTPEYPNYQEFAALTRAQEALGLLNNTRGIGTRLGWEEKLKRYGVEIQEHTLIKKQTHINAENLIPKIERHKAAIIRHDFSRPVRLALDAGLFSSETTFFDYGCGHGGDMKRIADQGYSSNGWDPYYLPDAPRIAADVVNIGFVINVIEDQGERREALIKAWELTQRVLLVSAQVLISDAQKGVMAYGDGIITRRNTFQKYYEQEELKVYIDQVLGVDAIPIALGVCFVFRDPAETELFRASRYRSRATTPKVRACIQKFEEHRELLAPLMAFMTERGRIPGKGELLQEEEICQHFSSLRRAFQVIIKATDSEEWEAIADKRRQDLLVYLALTKFSHRPRLSQLPPAVQEDILGLYSSYKQACLDADQMLRSVGNTELIIKRCQESKIGKKLPNSLWVHISALQALDPLLRLYEGCASRTIGRLEEANVIKFHLKTPKISYLFYPDFDTEPHPTLYRSMTIDLRDLQVTYKEYDIDDDPPILHQLENLVTSDYPLYDKLVKLTIQEEDRELLENWQSISNLSGWKKCLKEHFTIIKGYKLYWCKDADPYKLKLFKSALNNRKKERQKTIELLENTSAVVTDGDEN